MGATTSRMNDSDALLWKMGRDPVLRSPVVAVIMLDASPRWEELQARVGRLTETMPRFRSKPSTGALGARVRPRWTEDHRFDLDVHLRRIAAAAPGTQRSVLDIAQVMGTTAFDPELPLWEAVVVEELSGGCAAVVIKLHHAIVDGVGGLALLADLFDADADAGPVSATESGSGRGKAEAASAPALWVSRALRDTIRAPLVQAQRATTVATSVLRLLAPAPRPLSPVMTGRGLGRRFEVLDVSADRLHEVSGRAGRTMNDVFVSALLGGVRRYHHKHGVDIDRLRLLMPVNIRGEADGKGSNHFVPVRFSVALNDDPVEQLDAVHREADTWKGSPALKVSPTLAVGLNLLPSPVTAALWGSMLKGDDLVATNVPGVAAETFLTGARVEALYAFAPTTGAALNAALVTMHHRACIGVNIDTSAVPDSEVLMECLAMALDDVLNGVATSDEVS